MENSTKDADKENPYLTDDDICSLKVTALKGYLRQHGQYVNGKKADLVERAKGVQRSELKDVNEVNSSDNTLQCLRREEKLVTALGEKIPEPSSMKGWTSNVVDIPNFSENETYNYLVLTIEAKRQFRSKVYFEDRHVHSIEFHPVSVDCSHCLVRCKVIPSLPTSNKKENPDHTVWVCLSKVSGKVNSADCNCTAGTGEACNHIAALLYALEDVTSKKKDGSISSTSLKCKWNNPRKRKLSPSRVQDLNFSKQCLNNQKDAFAGNYMKPTVNVDRFKKKLVNANSNAAWLTFHESDETEDKSQGHKQFQVPHLHHVGYMYHDSVDLECNHFQTDFQSKFDKMTITLEQATEIELHTRGQSTSKLWFSARCERITSSKFGNVCKMKLTTKPDNNLRDILGYREFQSKYCEWGLKHEPVARRVYEISMQSKQMKVDTCGLLINTKYPHLGASPDGLVLHAVQCHNKGLLEIKCPAADRWKHLHPEECAKHSDFFCVYDENDNSVKLRRSHNYYYQIQGQMMIADREWCDFVVWTVKGWTVERVQIDQEFCEDMLKRLSLFYRRFVLPEIFSHRVKRGVKLNEV